jgi:hypothetical protein
VAEDGLRLQRRRGDTVRRGWPWVAGSMLAIFVAGYGVGVPLSVANGSFEQDSSLLVAFAGFMVVGVVIVTHRPGNAVGWSFSAIGLLTATGVLATAYATRTRPGIVAWCGSGGLVQLVVVVPDAGGVLVLPPLVVPTGRLLSTRWRPVAAVAAAGTVAVITLSAVQPMLQDEDHHPIRNPIGRAGVPDPEEGALGPSGSGCCWCARPRRSPRWCCGFAAPRGWSASG